MKTQRGLIIAVTAILLSFLIPCIVSPAESSASGSIPGSTPRFKALASSLEATPDEKTVTLTVRVKDDAGKPVTLAHVNVYRGILSSLIVRPPDYQQDTNTSGIATFQIVVKTGEALKLSIEVAREDLQTENRDMDKGTEFPTKILEEFKLKPKSAAGGIDVISVGVNVLDDGFNLVEGAKVLIREFGERYQGTTDRDGKVVIAVQFTLKKTYTIEVSKSGYKPNKKFIELDKPQVGTTVFGGNITIEKTAAGGVEVTISVKDEENSNKAVAEAVVVLDSASSAGYYSKTTDESGNATFFVLETGSFAVRISQDYYEPLPKTELRLLAGETNRSFNFTLKAKPKSDGGRDTIDVTVLANDPGDEKSKPKPLAGALVKIGRGSAGTDSSGRVTLTGTFGARQDVTAEATGYKSQTKAVSVSRLVAFSVGTGSATFTLEPELSESSPIRLIVEVRNAAVPNNPLEGANVLLRLNGKIVGQETTTNEGEASFELKDSSDASLAKLRSGIRLDVAKDKYKVKWSDVTADLLQPSTKASRVTVFLERDWDELRKAIDALEQRVLAWNNDIAVAGKASELARKLAEQAPQAREKVAALLREIEFAGKAASAQGISTASLQCREAARLKSNILGYKSEAPAKEKALKALLDNASALAANCSSVKDGEAIRRMYREAIQLIAAIGSLGVKAVKDSDELKNLANEKNDLKKIIEGVEKNVAEIRQEAGKAEQAAAAVGPAFVRAENLTKSLSGRHAALTGELQKLITTYNLDKDVEGLPADLIKRVDVMTQLLGKQNSNVFGGPNRDWPRTVQEVSNQLQRDQASAEKLLALYKGGTGGNCDVEAMDGVVQEIGAISTNSNFEFGLAADLPNKAQACINKGNCQPIINQARGLLGRYAIEEAAAKINEARTQGCDVSGLDEELDYWKTLRDAVVYLKVRQQRCEFREAYEWSLNLPASIRSRPLMAETLADVYNGLKAQERIGQLRRSAKEEVARTNKVSSAEPFIRQAEQIAAPYPCLVEEVSKFRGEFPATGKADQTPADEVPGALGTDKGDKETLTDEVPAALGDGGFWERTKAMAADVTKALGDGPGFWERTKSKATDNVPTALGGSPAKTKPGSKGIQTPTDEVPGAIGSTKGKQTPTDEVPGVIGSTNGRPPVSDGAKSEDQLKDPNQPRKSEPIGNAIGAGGTDDASKFLGRFEGTNTATEWTIKGAKQDPTLLGSGSFHIVIDRDIDKQLRLGIVNNFSNDGYWGNSTARIEGGVLYANSEGPSYRRELIIKVTGDQLTGTDISQMTYADGTTNIARRELKATRFK